MFVSCRFPSPTKLELNIAALTHNELSLKIGTRQGKRFSRNSEPF